MCMLMFKDICELRSRLEYTISPGLAWDLSISKHRKCCKYHSKCNYRSVINSTSLAGTTGGFSHFRHFWQWAGTRGRSWSPDTEQASKCLRVASSLGFWLFSPSLSWCCDGRSSLLHILNICNVFLEQWLSIRSGIRSSGSGVPLTWKHQDISQQYFSCF